MGKTYVALKLFKSGDMRLLSHENHAVTTSELVNFSGRCVSQTLSKDFLKESGKISYFHLNADSEEAWSSLGSALAEGKPFIAAVSEEYLPRFLDIGGSIGLAFPNQRANLLQNPFPEDDSCLASPETGNHELQIGILRLLAAQDRFHGFGSLKCKLRNSLPGLNALTPGLDNLLEQGFIQEHYDHLGSDEVSETYAITEEGLSWLRQLEEAENSPETTPQFGALLFAD